MKRRELFGACFATVAVIAACADSVGPEDHGTPVEAGASPPTNDASDASDAGEDAGDGAADEGDSGDPRCGGGWCYTTLPDSLGWSMARWGFVGVWVDPVLGAFAIAAPSTSDGEATSQVLRFDGSEWRVAHPVLDNGRRALATAIAGDGAGHVVVVAKGVLPTSRDVILLHIDGTSTWSERAPLAGTLSACWFTSPDALWIAHGNSVSRRVPSDGGAGWVTETLPGVPRGVVQALWGGGSDDLFAVSNQISVEYGQEASEALVSHRTVDEAGTPRWSTVTFPLGPTGPAVPPDERGTIGSTGWGPWVGGWNLLSKGSWDAGELSFTQDRFIPPVNLKGIWGAAPTDIWAVGELGRLYHYDGTGWRDARTVINGAPIIANLAAISGLSTGEIWVVGANIALHRKP